MRLSEEQALQDDNRFANRNALAELKYCGWEIPQRKAITNDEIRFYAWLCRSAVALLKEQEHVSVYEAKISRCACGNIVNRYWYPNFCGFCGRELKWE